MFLRSFVQGRERVSEWELLDSAAHRLSGRTTSHDTSVDNSVRDANRINQSFWSYLSAHYGNALGHRVALPRLFLNCGIRPWFRFVWNIDRVYLQGDYLWHFEVKHKYPIAGTPLTFGLNDGELRLIGNLTLYGLRSLPIQRAFWLAQPGCILNRARTKSGVVLRFH